MSAPPRPKPSGACAFPRRAPRRTTSRRISGRSSPPRRRRSPRATRRFATRQAETNLPSWTKSDAARRSSSTSRFDDALASLREKLVAAQERASEAERARVEALAAAAETESALRAKLVEARSRRRRRHGRRRGRRPRTRTPCIATALEQSRAHAAEMATLRARLDDSTEEDAEDTAAGRTAAETLETPPSSPRAGVRREKDAALASLGASPDEPRRAKRGSSRSSRRRPRRRPE